MSTELGQINGLSVTQYSTSKGLGLQLTRWNHTADMYHWFNLDATEACALGAKLQEWGVSQIFKEEE